MKAKIEIRNGSYGFGKTWTLIIGKKSFYLGQDLKFCNRVLGLSPQYIVNEIGSGEIEKPSINKRLANFIIDRLELTKENINNLNPWDLCVE
jgi:hypothetical protein